VNYQLVEQLFGGWCKMPGIRFGLAGIAVIPSYTTGQDDRFLFPFLKRFPGLDYANSGSFSDEIDSNPRGIKTVSWLNFIDHEFVAKLGGAKTIRLALGAGAQCDELADGLMLKTGGKPLLGDTNEDSFPDGYSAVSRATMPILFMEYNGRLFKTPEPMDDLSETQKWLKRFVTEDGRLRALWRRSATGCAGNGHWDRRP
jgi:Protein of unknown function (DUF3396)